MLVVLAVAHFISGIAGFGATLMVVPTLVFIYGTEELPAIVALALCGGMAQCVMMAYRLWRQADFQLLRHLMIPAVVTMPLGLVAVRLLPQSPLLLGLALCLLVAGARCFGKGSEDVEAKHYRSPFHWLIGAATGTIHGAFGTGGAALIGWLRYVRPEKNVFRASIVCCWVVLNGCVILGNVAAGWPASLTYDFLVFGIPLVFGVTVLGDRLAHKVPQRPFTIGVGVLLLLTALSLTVSAIRG